MHGSGLIGFGARMRAGITGVATLGLILAAPAAADAAQRFVTTGGSGTACTSAAPCDIVTGINSAPAGSEVIIAAGTYPVSADLGSANANLSIHGATTADKPVINSSASLAALDINALGATVSDLRINVASATNEGLYLPQGGTVNRLDVRSAGLESCFIRKTTTMRDSICANSAANGTALQATTVTAAASISLRNVDAIATGTNSGGIEAFASSQALNVDARNVIARGTAADVYGDSSLVTVTLQNSSFANVNNNAVATISSPTTNANQTAAPIFADAEFRPAANSPTVDAGATDGLTATIDLEGKIRPQGSAIDIGAYELAVVAPPPPPPGGDTTPPETTIVSGPKKKSASKKASFEFSSGESGSTFQCKLDKGSLGSCSSPQKYSHLKKGRHTFSVVATDSSGNSDASPATYSWTVKKKKKSHGHH